MPQRGISRLQARVLELPGAGPDGGTATSTSAAKKGGQELAACGSDGDGSWVQGLCRCRDGSRVERERRVEVAEEQSSEDEDDVRR